MGKKFQIQKTKILRMNEMKLKRKMSEWYKMKCDEVKVCIDNASKMCFNDCAERKTERNRFRF